MDNNAILTLLLAVSALLQTCAALFAIRLIRVAGRRVAWVLISLAMILMALRRILPLYYLLSGNMLPYNDFVNETLGLVLSLFMLVGVVKFGPIFIEREKAERALVESESKLRVLTDTVADAITMIDDNGDVVYWNPAAERIFGYAAREVMGKSLHLLLAPERFHELYRKGFGRYRETGSGPTVGKTLELEAVKKDGAEIPVEVSFSIAILNDKRYAIGSIRDISDRVKAENERRRLEEQLRQAQKMEAIGQMAGGIAHDFNNILMAIIGFSNILKMKLDQRDPMQGDIDQILFASDRAAYLTKGLLAYSRQQIMTPRPVDLNHIVISGEQFLRRVIGENVELIYSYSEEPLDIIADSVQLEQVLMNIATNARDAMPHGGTLKISTGKVEIDDQFLVFHEFAKKGIYALVELSDNGAGMDEITQKRIFEPFFTTKEVGKGTGLGLSVVYGIVKQHDGFIICESKPKRGTTFRIYLPIVNWDGKKDEVVACRKPLGGNETILLAEDDPQSRNVTRLILENFGYRVIEAWDGEDAIEKFRGNRDEIKLALLDVIMPKFNGGEVLKRMREINPEVKAIFMSGYAADFLCNEDMIGESTLFLAKPAMMKDLLIRVREVLAA
jgi:PAS domain S-box-containing protein